MRATVNVWTILALMLFQSSRLSYIATGHFCHRKHGLKRLRESRILWAFRIATFLVPLLGSLGGRSTDFLARAFDV